MTPALRLGARAHDLGQLPADDLARLAAGLGLSGVQLAVNKALPGPDRTASDLTPAFARDLRDAFARHHVRIDVLGCYINPLHPDPATRAALHAWFRAHLRLARDIGCPVVALETGSLHADYSPHPDNHGEAAFLELVRSLAPLVEAAEWNGVTLGIEAVTVHTVFNPARMRRLLDTLASPRARVVLDPVNLLHPGNAAHPDDVLRDALDQLGNEIVVVHAKDFVRDGDSLRTVPAGSGELDYGPLLRWLVTCGRDVPLLLEETGPDVIPACRAFLTSRLNTVTRPEPVA